MKAQAQEKNGNAQGAQPEPEKGELSLVKQSPKGEAMQLKPLKENEPLTVEETIRRVNELQDNIDKREVLKNHLLAVTGLKFGEYDDKDRLVLVKNGGEKYEIKSTSLCQECAELVKHRISEHIEEVEQLIVL